VHLSLQSKTKIVSALCVVVLAIILVTGLLARPTGSHASYGNPFPYPSCTWGAAQEYYNLHHVWVPWRTQAMAWQWTARAYQFHWHVSTHAVWGSIINLQPWVQGAYGGGHVEVVIRVYRDGSVLAIGTNWGRNIYAWAPWHFHPGRGVTFIWK
jgi:surface antigen